ncbi:hypothetical protein [Baekduia sp. Peel2402]|uniref:hypothetical protein n=1 Tax=Baekduia sp. Peel2402 TaxID=3458296 RepID=UPI00403E75B5
MSRMHWMGTVFAIGALAAPASAQAKTAPRTPEATVRAYLAAVDRGDAQTVCAMSQRPASVPMANCRGWVSGELKALSLRRVRIAPVLRRGSLARTVVETVAIESGRPDAIRARVVLGHAGGRWRVISAGALPGTPTTSTTDLAPKGRAAALRRLADDELLALSGNDFLCDLLAPGAPLGGQAGACRAFPTDLPGTLRLAGLVVHLSGASRARLDARIAITRTVRTGRKGYALRTRRTTDTLQAVRVKGRWRLVKPSRAFYRAVGVDPPIDVDAPTATATWPAPAARPSVSGRAVPATCLTPPPLWSRRDCADFNTIVAAPRPGGGALVGWTTGLKNAVRTVVDGAPVGPVVAEDADSRRDWMLVDGGLVALAGGLLAIEQDVATMSVRAIPLDADGHPRGPAQVVDRGVSNPEDGAEPTILAAPPNAAAATIVTGKGMLVRIGADGRRVAADVRFGEDSGQPVVLADGALVLFGGSRSGGIAVVRLTGDGRSTGPEVSQPPVLPMVETQVAAVAADGRVLFLWSERGETRAVVRAWVYDPSAPLDRAPVTLADFRLRKAVEDDGSSFDATAHLAASALPGGGWGVAFLHPQARDGDGTVRGLRLDVAGTPLGSPRAVPGAVARTGYGRTMTLAGDTLAWVEPLPEVGLPQVQAAPLP